MAGMPVDGTRRSLRVFLRAANPGKYRRQKVKEQARDFLLSKWERLEERRIQIIGRMASLKHYHAHVEDLKRTNTALKSEYKALMDDMNGKITQVQTSNEKLQSQIIKIERQFYAERQSLRLEFKAFEMQAAADIGRLEQRTSVLNRTLNDIEDEVKRLETFRDMLERDPLAMEKLVQQEELRKLEVIGRQDGELGEVKRRWEAEQAEIEHSWMQRVKALIDGMNNQVLDSVDLSPNGAHQKNKRLHHELRLHSEQQRLVRNEIRRIQQLRIQFKDEENALRDPRRDVLSLKDKMTCSPETWFECSKTGVFEHSLRDEVQSVMNAEVREL
ncbi:hypothetical protein DFJ73DRAFT_484290 [Zopfochytrium polystomum]|nr:hypothetical protein DFJ73DRAFT_484290 [Zopfochytrium polystomum]